MKAKLNRTSHTVPLKYPCLMESVRGDIKLFVNETEGCVLYFAGGNVNNASQHLHTGLNGPRGGALIPTTDRAFWTPYVGSITLEN